MKKVLLLCCFMAAAGTFQCAGQVSIPIDTARKNRYQRLLALPLIIRTPETNWGFGYAAGYFFKMKKNNDSLRTSDVNLVALYTLRRQVVIVLGSTVFFDNEKKILRFNGSYSYYPDKSWGIGNYSPETAAENYNLKQFFFNPQILYKLYYNFYIGGSYEFQRVLDFNYMQGGVFERHDIIGRKGGITSGLGALITWDRRNNAYSPDRGFFAEMNFTAFHKTTGSDFNFTTLSVDMRKFFLLNKGRVAALQAVIKINNGSVPFRNLSFLGGPEIMRGFYKGRFADDNMTGFQAELRQHVIGRVGIAGFVSAGEVSKDIAHFSLNGFHYTYGGGLRILLKKSEKLNLRIDYGRGENLSGVYVFLKEAF